MPGCSQVLILPLLSLRALHPRDAPGGSRRFCCGREGVPGQTLAPSGAEWLQTGNKGELGFGGERGLWEVGREMGKCIGWGKCSLFAWGKLDPAVQDKTPGRILLLAVGFSSRLGKGRV